MAIDRGLLAAGAVPLALGAALPTSLLDGPVLCPFRALTGLPCPLCGATRAFVLFGHGDGRWASYGAVWVVVALSLVVVALSRRPRVPLWAGAATSAAVAWAWALAHAGTIAP